MVGLGLAVVTAAGRTKFPFVRLTQRGEAVARVLAGVPTLNGGRWLPCTVAGLSMRDPATFDQLWVDEIALNGGKGWGRYATRAERGRPMTTDDPRTPLRSTSRASTAAGGSW